MPNNQIINMTDVRKAYRTSAGVETEALKGVSFSVIKGEFIAIMGSSGSGKSSLMNIIGLLDRNFTGKYYLDNKDISKLSDSERSSIRSDQIGFVFQQFNLLKRTSVLENVLLPTTYKAMENAEMRAIELIRSVGLEKYIDNNTNQLSGGQMQRVAIARSLMMKPKLLLADEPTGNLDHKTAHEIMSLLQEINNQGTTIVLITHEDDIAQYANRQLKIYDGLISEGGAR